VAFYLEKDFFADVELYELTQRVMSGDLTLHWFEAKTEHVKCEPKDPRRGLTYEDCNVGSYSYDQLPEFVRHNYSMAPRGAELWGKLPDLGYTVNRKSDVWSDNVATLYEEAKSRRWSPAVDIPWAELSQANLPEVIEAAVAQICTLLQETATVAMGLPSRWVYSINQEFLELKSYLSAQILDYARHVEVFRKRALTGGQGLKRASVTAEQALKELLSAETYPEGSLAGNLLLGSFLLGLYRYAETVAPTAVDQRIFRLTMQDAARTVAYGVGNIRYHLTHQPQQESSLHDYLGRTEHCLLGLIGSPECLEPLIVLSGRGTTPEQIQAGCRLVSRFLAQTAAGYLERCERAGLSGRRARSRLPQSLKRLGVPPETPAQTA